MNLDEIFIHFNLALITFQLFKIENNNTKMTTFVINPQP